MRIEFVSVELGGRWWNIIVLNVYAETGDKYGDTNVIALIVKSAISPHSNIYEHI